MILETAVLCLALNIYHESRGEPEAGQHAVAQVTLNRAGWNNDKVCEVVTKPKQFSWTNGLVAKVGTKHVLKEAGRPKDLMAFVKSYEIAKANINRIAPMVISKNVDHYHAKRVTPKWSRAFIKVARIGDHIFYKQS